MTKAELIELAKDVELMDKLNTISALLEVNNESDKELINSLVDDIYNSVKTKDTISLPKGNKKWLLAEIKKMDPKAYEEVKDQTFSLIKWKWYMMTNKNK